MKTQKQIILNLLKGGSRLTSMSGLQHGIIRMTNRINELRADGEPIKDEWVKNPVTKSRYKVYSYEN